MVEKKNIYQRINAVMSECDYIQKKQAQQGKGVKYDEVMAMIRQLLIKHGIVMVMRQKSMDQIGGLEGKNQKVYQGAYEMDLVNMDNPEEKVTHTAYAHGMDGGDKAPGKAHTYAAKLMLVKGFGIETGEDDESRSEKIDRQNVITKEQLNWLLKYCTDNGYLNQIGLQLTKAFKINDLRNMPSSKFKQATDIIKERLNVGD